MFNFFYDNFEQYKETRIQKRRFDEKTWQELIQAWTTSPWLRVEKIGETFEKRAIHEITFGQGPIQIIAWSQMHGDEATATMALCDIFNFINSNDPSFTEIREILHQNLTIHFIPYLNADGAARWTRETALGIDMNRDAQMRYSPEAQLLSDWADRIKPTFAFNLHDQNRLYSVGNSVNQTHIAFLATAGDEAGTWTESRLRAGKLANRLTRLTQQIIPNKVAKWTDEFNARAFGDTFQQRDYGLLLLESGGAGWDLEKQSLRQLNAAIILDAFHSIATGSYQQENIETYEALATNERQIYDIKLTQAPLEPTGKIRADIGINLKETASDKTNITYSWLVEEIGNLAYMHALNTIDASQFNFTQAITLGEEISDLIFTKGGETTFDLRTFTAKIK
jgi:Zinc carboxypeptidase